MKRQIKSKSEIKKEITAILDNASSDDKAATMIKSFLKKVTGKELINKREIENLVYIEILQRDFRNKTNLQKNKKIIEIIPKLKNIDNIKKLFRKKILGVKPPNNKIGVFYNLFGGVSPLLFLSDIILTAKEFEKYIELDTPGNNVFNIVSNDNPSFKKLLDFITNNEDVAELLIKYIADSKRKFLCDLITNKDVHLKSVFVYFDKDRNIKENTEYFYNLLNKKISRSTIQTAIHENLRKIKEGKYILPH